MIDVALAAVSLATFACCVPEKPNVKSGISVVFSFDFASSAKVGESLADSLSFAGDDLFPQARHLISL